MDTDKAGYTLLPCCSFVLVDQIQVGQGGMDVDCPLDELSSASGLSDPGRSFPSAHLAQSIPLVNAAVVLCVIKPQPSH